MTDDFVLK
jgi:predicted metal-dependent HD superfamily phosphohydrolase